MIGVFDSGLGGLTILQKLLEDFPDQRFLYFGDSAFAPYGGRSEREIYALTRRGVEYLFERGCRLVIIACNTACAIALRPLQQEWLPRVSWGQMEKGQMGKGRAGISSMRSPHNVIGVLVPLIEVISEQEWHIAPVLPHDPPREVTRVGFFATRATVTSNRFVTEMERMAPHIQVFQQACPRLAEFIEAQADIEDIKPGIQRYVRNLMTQARASGVELAVLGCTHYQLVAPLFSEYLPPHCKLVNQPQAVSRSLKSYLARRPDYGRPDYGRPDYAALRTQQPGVDFVTSGDPETVSEAAAPFWTGPTPALFRFKDDYKKA